MEKDEARTQQCRMMRNYGDNGVGDDGKSEDGVSRLCCGESID